MNWLVIWILLNQAFLDGHLANKENGPYPDALVIPLTISPAARPLPNVRYQISIPRSEAKTGNAAYGYLAAVKALPGRLADRDEERSRQRRMDDWLSSKPGDLQLDWVRKELQPYQGAIRKVHDSAKMIDCNWPDPRPRRITSVNNADIQKLRELLTPLELQFKVEMAGKQYDEAFESIRTLYQFGFHECRGSDMFRVLVGFATISKSHQSVAAWMNDPHSPNLYEALASRPKPFFHPQTMLEGEREVFLDFCKYFRHCNRSVMTDEEVLAIHVECELKLLSLMAFGFRLIDAFTEGKVREPGYTDWILDGLAPFREAAEAKRDLIRRGWSPNEIERMHPIQAAYASAWLRSDERWKQAVAIWDLPLEKRLPRFLQWDQQLRDQ